MLCSLKTAVNHQHEGGWRRQTGKSKEKITDRSRRWAKHGQKYDQGGNAHEENMSTNEGPDIKRVSADGSPALEQYNVAWNALRRADVDAHYASGRPPDIPWPTRNLQYASFGQYDLYNYHDIYSSRALPSEIINDSFQLQFPTTVSNYSFQLQKWKTFSFFVEAFGFKAYYDFEPVGESHSLGTRHGRGMKSNEDEEPSRLIFHIDTAGNAMSRTRRQLEALKSQMQHEKLRWHPDRWRLSMTQAVGTLTEEKMESAKAVWGAIVEISQACDAHLRAGSQ